MVAGWMVAYWPCPAIEVRGALSVAGGHRAPIHRAPSGRTCRLFPPPQGGTVPLVNVRTGQLNYG